MLAVVSSSHQSKPLQIVTFLFSEAVCTIQQCYQWDLMYYIAFASSQRPTGIFEEKISTPE